jgi:hypothetical protein
MRPPVRLDNDDMAGDRADGYAIEDHPSGRTLVVTGRWTPEATTAAQRLEKHYFQPMG